MRIGIIGAAGAGKTALSGGLSKRLGIVLVDEGVREWLWRKGLSSPWDLSEDLQIELQWWYLKRKIHWEQGSKSFVSDRTSLDAVVLSRMRGLFLLDRRELTLMEEIALRHARRTYDVLFLRKAGLFGVGDDGCRDTNKERSNVEESLLVSLASKVDVPIVVVAEQDLERALEYASRSVIHCP